MAFFPSDLSLLRISDLETLIAAGEPESETLEFKSQPYVDSPDGSREFLKDATALANTSGGILIVGIQEVGGVATELKPISSPDFDKHQLRLQNLLQSSVEPRLFGVQMQPVVLSTGYVLIIRVPPSNYPPHRVSAQNSNRFYLRHSAGVYEASLSELRGLFAQTGASSERLEALRRRRLSEIESSPTIVLVDRADRLILHIAPLSSNLGRPVDMAKAYAESASLSPMDSNSYSPMFNADGFAAVGAGENCHGYTQIFREGLLEATKVGIVTDRGGERILPARWIDTTILAILPRYLSGLQKIGISPPWIVMLSLVGINGVPVRFGHDAYFSRDAPSLTRSALLLPSCLIADLGTPEDYTRAIKPALDALWNAGGSAEWAPQR